MRWWWCLLLLVTSCSVELDDVKAPNSAKNFTDYVKQGHYD